MDKASHGYYWVRWVGPDGAVASKFMHLAAGGTSSARLLAEELTGGAVLFLAGLPRWLNEVLAFLGRLLRRPLPAEALADFCHNLGIMLKSGLPIDAALRELHKDTTDREVKAMIAHVLATVCAGHSPSHALERYAERIPPAVRFLVSIGEQSGNLDRVLLDAAVHIKRLQIIQKDIRRALFYPCFVLTTISGVVFFWVYYVLPDLMRMFQQMGAKLPAKTLMAMHFVLSLERFFRYDAWLYASAALVALAMLLRHPRARYEMYRLGYRLPVLSRITRPSAMAFITEYLALLLAAGITLAEALQILQKAMRNPFYNQKIGMMVEGVARGNMLSHEMERAGVFPAMVTRLVNVGEQSGSLDTQLRILADDYRKKLDHVISSLSVILQPVMITLVGGLFIAVVAVFLLPVYQLISQTMR